VAKEVKKGGVTTKEKENGKGKAKESGSA